VSATTTLREGGREIRLNVLGRAHTNGDLFISLPKEKVVVSGDALIDWMPFMNDGYPAEWPETLTALEKIQFDHIIPGHGDVRPKSHLAFFRGYFVDLIAAVRRSAEGASLHEIRRRSAIARREIRERVLEVSARPLPCSCWHERRGGLHQGRQEGLTRRPFPRPPSRP
jgi:glyoxylase-like metal-dependent hydrolase (beta-lactamase superfamily II)